MSIDEIINQINSKPIIQNTSYEDQEELEFIMPICQEVAQLDVDKHRHYETSIVVYSYQGEFFGIRVITDMFSDMSSYDDMFWTIKAFRMKEVTIVSYEIVQ